MSITVICDGCGKVSQVADEHAGKRAKCGRCHGPVVVPSMAAKPAGFADEFDANAFFDPTPAASSRSAPSAPGETEACYFCGEEILAVARKCKHCGEFLDPSARPSTNQVFVSNSQSLIGSGVIRSGGTAAWNPGIAAILSFFLPGVGQMYKGQADAGVKWLLGTIVGYICFIIPGLIVHLVCVINAATSDPNA